MPSYKLTYFPLPGRAENVRVMFAVGGIPLEDNRIGGPAWPELKPKTTFGQLPILEVNGKMLAQSSAIDRFAAKINGLYPADPFECALADQAYALLGEVSAVFSPTFNPAMDPATKIATRIAICEGALRPKMAMLTTLIETKSGEFLAGSKLSFADVAVFVALSNMISGFMDGIPVTLLNDYPVIKAYRNKIAAIPAIKAYYENETEGFRLAFKVME
jgi:glutathione S-transferase